ncbi:MAG: hypothetical protein QM605_13040 [Sphingobium sp.]
MTQDIDAIVNAMSDAFGKDIQEGVKTMIGFGAERINVVHEPPQPTDGPIKTEFLAAALPVEWRLFQTGLDDFSLSPEVRKLDESKINVRLGVGGKLDGEAVNFTGNIKLGLQDGRIVELVGGWLDDGVEVVKRVAASPKAAPLFAELMQFAGDMENHR